MEYITLRGTDIKVSRIAMGCWGISGGRTWGERNDELSLETIRTAFEHGITFFDTAIAYGKGDSEKLLGRAISDVKHTVAIATKISPRFTSTDEIIQQCEYSLQCLDRDYIDLYQLHWYNPEMPPIPDILDTLFRLKEQGKVRSVGVCNLGKGQLDQVPHGLEVITNQLPYNLLWRAIEFDITPLCRERQMGILAYSPLMQGLLTGRFTKASQVPEGRARTKHFAPGPGKKHVIHGNEGCEDLTFQTIRKLLALSRQVNIPLSELALAWLLEQPGVSVVLAGAREPDQAVANASAADRKLTEELLQELDNLTAELKARLGRDPDMWQSQGRIY